MIAYVGIAMIHGPSGYRQPVYQSAYGSGATPGYLISGGYAPHFRATDDRTWLEVTLHSGSTGWIRNDPAHVTVVLPNPDLVTICVDPGHGGAEMGAQAFGLVEKTINFDVAFWKLHPKLAADKRIGRIWYTRNGDYDVSLRYRWDLANASGCNLFLSVHANSHPDPTVRGTEAYFKCGSDATAALKERSQRAACLISRNVLSQIGQWGSVNCPPTDRGLICRLVSTAEPVSYYYVLENTQRPAVLIEVGYMSNRSESYCLANSTFRGFLAQGIYDGIAADLFTDQPGTGCAVSTMYSI
jgi:N-acetylmuramoyl-L-alanine amidase